MHVIHFRQLFVPADSKNSNFSNQSRSALLKLVGLDIFVWARIFISITLFVSNLATVAENTSSK